MIWLRLTRLMYTAIGDDGVGSVWDRLTPDGREVLRLAFVESRELGHPYLADEHVVLGLLRHGTSAAAALLRRHGLDLAAARTDLLAAGPALGPHADPAAALGTLGIDVGRVRRHLEAAFGVQALQEAERRVRRRPWWRGGHSRPSPLCAYLLAKRSFQFAADYADRTGHPRIGPDHLLYGVLRDARDPLGTQLSRRSRKNLAALGWIPGQPNPVRTMLQTRGLDITRLTTELGGQTA